MNPMKASLENFSFNNIYNIYNSFVSHQINFLQIY